MRVYTHPSFLAHDPGPDHPEHPGRLRAVLAALEAGVGGRPAAIIEAPAAPREALTRVHPPDHLALLERVALEGGGVLDGDTFMNAHSYQAAVHAAGATMEAARSALTGTAAFAAVRPPGHHATATRPMGFCLINNVVVAARSCLEESGLARVLIVDWDVHHGNGTQDLVEHDARIRYVSLHQWPLYPGTGRADERGVGNIFNVPRPPGLPREQYVRDLAEAVERATDGWTPELILLSAGFDALAGDPLGGFTLEPEDYATWVRLFRTLGAPVASTLEGGYAPSRMAQAVMAHLEALDAA